MVRVIAKNYSGFEMTNETFETMQEADDFISFECFPDWEIEKIEES